MTLAQKKNHPKNSRKVGDDLEDKVVERLGPGFSKTAGSGSVFKNGDIAHHRLVTECKVKNNTKGFSAPASELKKLIKEADKQSKDWLYIQQSGLGKTMVLCDLNTFLEMTELWRKNQEPH